MHGSYNTEVIFTDDYTLTHKTQRVYIFSKNLAPTSKFYMPERRRGKEKVKGKGKVRSRTGHEGHEKEQMYSSTISLTSALDGRGWLTPRPGRFTPGENSWYPFHTRLGRPQGQSGRMR
jgi:hypothetical protein